jgi:hypothetical protein
VKNRFQNLLSKCNLYHYNQVYGLPTIVLFKDGKMVEVGGWTS